MQYGVQPMQKHKFETASAVLLFVMLLSMSSESIYRDGISNFLARHEPTPVCYSLFKKSIACPPTFMSASRAFQHILRALFE